MGLSFHDQPSLVEAVSSLQFASDNPEVGSQDGSLRGEPHNPNANLEMGKDGRDNDGGSDYIQTADRRVIGLKDSCLCH
jgi:hypothetical protein